MDWNFGGRAVYTCEEYNINIKAISTFNKRLGSSLRVTDLEEF